MYEKLLIDGELRNSISEELLNLFNEKNINYKFFNGKETLENNVLFLTNNKHNLKSKYSNVFLLSNDYDFLDVKNSIFIKNLEDVIRVYESGIWQSWAKELQFLAQCSLAYSKDKFDRERAERIREISCEMLSYKYNVTPEKIKINFAGELGYQTPKVENRAAIIKDNKILLVKEQLDGKWALPGGYQDVDRSVRDNVIKEASEEAGAIVNPKKLIAVFDYNKHHHVNFPFGMVKIFVLCDYIKHKFENNTETADAKFFSLDNLPDLSITRTTYKQLEMCFDCYNNQETWDVLFD
ncbi:MULTISPECIES: NUDIX hydrolase [Gemella]|uniref:NUDIX hydrolase n=1 Tax=Gemella TaxID=1378 RepID=UPI000930C174|nr:MULTISPECIES: NUDIX hydrolase [Gemella]AXI27081.1 NUDIX hydrolase [Gemella sp. ND 6198]